MKVWKKSIPYKNVINDLIALQLNVKRSPLAQYTAGGKCKCESARRARSSFP